MSRTAKTVFAVLVAALAVSLAAGVVAGEVPTADTHAQLAEDDDIQPGERLTGVLGSQQAEMDGEVERRAVSNAADRGETLAERADALEDRIEETEERRDELRQMLEDGDISESEYRARMATLSTRLDNAEQTVSLLSSLAEEFDEDDRHDLGLTEDRLERLAERSEGVVEAQERREARGVMSDDPEQEVVDRVDRAADRLERAEAHVERAENAVESERGNRAVDRATEYLVRSETVLDEAREALDDGQHREARHLAGESVNFAGTARSYADRALRVVPEDDDDEADERAERMVERAMMTFDDATDTVERAREVVDDRQARSLLERAEDELDDAETALTAAREALDDGNEVAADRYARTSVGHSSSADTYAERAIAIEDGGTDDEREDAREAVSEAEDALSTAEEAIDRAAGEVDDGNQLLERARTSFRTSEDALTDAREAFDDSRYSTAERSAERAASRAELATEAATRAVEEDETRDRDDGTDEGAEFELSIQDTNSPITPDETPIVEVYLRNVGDERGTDELSVWGLGVDTIEFSLEAGAETTERVTLSTGDQTPEPGFYEIEAEVIEDGAYDSHRIGVESEDDDDEAEAEFDVEIRRTNQPVEQGDELDAEVRLRNVGDAEGETQVTLRLGTVAVTREEWSFELDEGEATTERMSIDTSDVEPGTDRLEVDAIDDVDEATVEIESRDGGEE